MRYLRNVTSLDRAAPGEREPPHSDAKIFEISAGRNRNAQAPDRHAGSQPSSAHGLH
jgi:hypothetical protein